MEMPANAIFLTQKAFMTWLRRSFSILQAANWYDQYAVIPAIAILLGGQYQLECRQRQGHLAFALVEFFDQLLDPAKVLRPFVYLPRPQLKLDQSVTAVFQMQNPVGFKPITILVVGNDSPMGGRVYLQIPDAERFE